MLYMSSALYTSPILIITLSGFLGGLVRGYSGFGFALAAVPILSIGFPPGLAVPAVFPLELSIGLLTLPFEWKKMDFKVLGRLILGAAIGTPLGVTILRVLPSDLMRVIVGIVVAVAIVRALKKSIEIHPTSGLHLIVIGTASGCLNGGTAMSGPPVIVTLLDGHLSAAIARATLIGFIAISAAFGVVASTLSGSYEGNALLISAQMVPAVVLGCASGLAAYSLVPRRYYRAISLTVLGVVVAISIASTAWRVVAG